MRLDTFLDRDRREPGPIDRLDPRIKLGVAALYVACVLATPLGAWRAFGLEFLVVVFIAAAAGIRAKWLIERWLALVTVFGFLAVLAALAHPRRAELGLFGTAASILAKNTLAVSAVGVLVQVTGFTNILSALAKLRAPAVLIATLLFMERYIHVLIDELDRMIKARRSRTFKRSGVLDWGILTGLLGVLFLRLGTWRTRARGDALQRLGRRRPIARIRRVRRAMTEQAQENSHKPAVEIRNLSFRYPDGRLALRNVDLTITTGETIALIGPNGAGKSTLLWHLNGLLPEMGGRSGHHGHALASVENNSKPSVWIDGIEVSRKYLPQVRRKVGLVFQDPDDQLFSTSVLEDVAFGPLNLGQSKSEARRIALECLAKVGLEALADRPPRRLSFGERKRVCVAGVLACEPTVLVLDEPTANLDPRARRNFLALDAKPRRDQAHSHSRPRDGARSLRSRDFARRRRSRRQRTNAIRTGRFEPARTPRTRASAFHQVRPERVSGGMTRRSQRASTLPPAKPSSGQTPSHRRRPFP